jgi:predicted metal-binding protein
MIMNRKTKTEIKILCRENKALDAKFIDPNSIVVGYWVRFKCQYGCGGYGKSLCCPPHSPTPDETKKIISDYHVALLAHFDGEANVSKTVATIERELFLMGYPKVISFGAGPCRLCKECTLTECKFPRLARPSMEASGIDVFSTAIHNGFPIQVLTSKDEERNRYGLILIE